MFDRRDDPRHLLASLGAFLDRFAWERPCPVYPADEAKLTDLPMPLRTLYERDADWIGVCTQDDLLPVDTLHVADGKLVFAVENQAVWTAATERAGEDPRVWARGEAGEPWTAVCSSLAAFLVTLVLQEITLGRSRRAQERDALERLRAAGMRVAPLWTRGPYVHATHDFHVVDNRILVMDGRWCGSDDDALHEVFPVPPRDEKAAMVRPPPTLARIIERTRLETLARQEEVRAEHHRERARVYAGLAGKEEPLGDD
jgi:hypothetical protein